MLTLLRQSADYSLSSRTWYHSLRGLSSSKRKMRGKGTNEKCVEKAVKSLAKVLTKACPLCYCKVNKSIFGRAGPYIAACAAGP